MTIEVSAKIFERIFLLFSVSRQGSVASSLITALLIELLQIERSQFSTALSFVRRLLHNHDAIEFDCNDKRNFCSVYRHRSVIQ